jgi:hypothetical protein
MRARHASSGERPVGLGGPLASVQSHPHGLHHGAKRCPMNGQSAAKPPSALANLVC